MEKKRKTWRKYLNRLRRKGQAREKENRWGKRTLAKARRKRPVRLGLKEKEREMSRGKRTLAKARS